MIVFSVLLQAYLLMIVEVMMLGFFCDFFYFCIAAMAGLRPIVEFMTFNFSMQVCISLSFARARALSVNTHTHPRPSTP